MTTEKTIRKYQKNVYLKKDSSIIIETLKNENNYEIILDSTIFFPEGGGQPSDTGTINGLPVSHVREEDGVIFHQIKLSDLSEEDLGKIDSMTPGTQVSCAIDWPNRFLNMQRHLGEHILSGTFADMYGGANRGFHMGEEYITVDIRLENDPSYDVVTMDMALEAEKKINEVIWADLPVTVKHFSDPAEAAKMPLRKELTIEDDDISIVTVGSEENPVDCVACCGTHPSGTAQVGLLKIYKVEKNKDMFRIFFDCGAMAMADYDEKHRIITDISDKHSAGLSDIEKKLAAEDSKNREIRQHLSTLASALAQIRADDILAEAAAEPDKVVFRRYSDMNAEDIMRIGKVAGPELKKPALVLSESEHTVLLFSDGSIHCGNLVRENASIYGGKGGGSDVQARAIFPDNKNIETFVDLIDKHLR